jgi:hypothetical protein
MNTITRYRLHRVTTLDTSISVNAWCPCSEFQMINNVTSVALPFDSNWNDATLRTGVRRFITLVLNTVGMKLMLASRITVAPQSFMKQLIQTRYILSGLIADTNSLQCPTSDVAAWQSLCGPLSSTMTTGAQPYYPEEYDAAIPMSDDYDIRMILDHPSLQQTYRERAFEIATHFVGHYTPTTAAPLFMDDDVRVISISNWIESLVAWTVGHEPYNVARFIHCCWRL